MSHRSCGATQVSVSSWGERTGPVWLHQSARSDGPSGSGVRQTATRCKSRFIQQLSITYISYRIYCCLNGSLFQSAPKVFRIRTVWDITRPTVLKHRMDAFWLFIYYTELHCYCGWIPWGESGLHQLRNVVLLRPVNRRLRLELGGAGDCVTIGRIHSFIHSFIYFLRITSTNKTVCNAMWAAGQQGSKTNTNSCPLD